MNAAAALENVDIALNRQQSLIVALKLVIMTFKLVAEVLNLGQE